MLPLTCCAAAAAACASLRLEMPARLTRGASGGAMGVPAGTSGSGLRKLGPMKPPMAPRLGRTGGGSWGAAAAASAAPAGSSVSKEDCSWWMGRSTWPSPVSCWARGRGGACARRGHASARAEAGLACSAALPAAACELRRAVCADVCATARTSWCTMAWARLPALAPCSEFQGVSVRACSTCIGTPLARLVRGLLLPWVPVARP